MIFDFYKRGRQIEFVIIGFSVESTFKRNPSLLYFLK